MLKLEHIRVVFHPHTINQRVALDDVSFTLNDDDFVCIIGGNGAGKSTLLNVISGSVQPDQGNIYMDQEDITHVSEHKRARMIGRLFQNPMQGTASHMTVLENLSLAYGRDHRSIFQKAINANDTAYFKERLSALQLGLEDRLDNEVGQLSGGQRQALTLLMATLDKPKLLLLDEHTAALDPKTAEIIMKETDRLIHQYQIPAIMITHNLKQALQYGNRLIIMQEGKIVRDMSAEEKQHTSIEQLLTLFDLY